MLNLKIAGKFFLRVFLFLLFLEIILRVAGFLTITTQSLDNWLRLKKGHPQYRIMCVGDSMTALGGKNSYPSQLETILNESQDKRDFVVFNKGLPGASIQTIVSKLLNNIDELEPNMVIVMIGTCLEPGYALGNEVKHKPWFKQLHVYRLLAAQAKHMQTQARITFKDFMLKKEIHDALKQLKANPSSSEYMKIGKLYHEAQIDDKAMDYLNKTVVMAPKNYEAWQMIAQTFVHRLEYEKAIAPFYQSLQYAPPEEMELKRQSYQQLEDIYLSLHKSGEIEQVYLHAMTFWPEDDWGYAKLGAMFFDRGDYKSARDIFMKELKINPHAFDAYGKVAVCLEKEGDVQGAKKLLMQAIQLNPNTLSLYAKLADLLIELKEYDEAQRLLESVNNLNVPDKAKIKGIRIEGEQDIYLYRLLIGIYLQKGNTAKAQDLKNKMEALKKEKSNGYQDVEEILRAKGIPLVAVQYPREDVKMLKDLFTPSSKAIFVDNQSSFNEGVLKDGYYDYFVDNASGYFGHCTPKGDRMLADNISKAILAFLNGELLTK